MRKEMFGVLSACVTGGTDGKGGGDGPVVVLLHGFGAPGDDLVALGRMLRVPKGVRYVFPAAPLSLAAMGYGDGRAWWMLDLDMMERRARGERIDRSEDVPDGLVQARSQLSDCLSELESRLDVAADKVILGGFSQGAMLACDVALHREQAPAGLILLSSTLLARSEWAPRMASRAGLAVLQSHGRSDALLPYRDAEALRDLWQAAGADLTFVEFPGGHEIPPGVLDAMARFITEQIDD